MDAWESIPADGRRSMYGGIGSRASIAVQGKRKPNPSLHTRPASPLTGNLLTFEEMDEKGRRILSEIDRCMNCKDKYVESSVLHNVPQTFLTSELRCELEVELDRMLMEQIRQEERQFSLDPGSNEVPGCRFDEAESTDNRQQHKVIQAYPDNNCLACNSRPCQWTLYADADALARRKKELNREMMFVQKQKDVKTIQSLVAGSVLNGGDTQFTPSELIQELACEIKDIDSKLKLNSIDNELHMAYASESDSVTIRSIHGFDTTVKRENAILALEHEHDRHIATTSAVEIIDGILEWYAHI